MAVATWFLLSLGFLIVVGLGAAVAVTVSLTQRSRLAPLPRMELATLGQAIARAEELASAGRVGDGLACLVAGQRQAERAQQQGTGWAPELVTRWRQVVEEYAAEHNIGPSPELLPAEAPPGRGDEPSSS